MKNKPLIIILLITVSLIWGNVVYKVVVNMFQDDEIPFTTSSASLLNLPHSVDRDFNLVSNYPDPFLKGNVSKSNSNPPKINSDNQLHHTQKKQPATIKKSHQWPTISFHGLVKRKDKKNTGLCIIRVDNQLINIRESEYFYDGYKIFKMYLDSVIILSETTNEKRTFRR